MRADLIIRCLGEATIGNVFGDVAKRFNSSCESRRELSVDEEAQSCAPQHRVIVLLGRELQDRGDIVGLEVGVVGQDLLARGTSSKEIQHIFDADAKTANARTPAANTRVHGDSVYQPPDRPFDPREPFTRDLNLPRGREREIVRDRDLASKTGVCLRTEPYYCHTEIGAHVLGTDLLLDTHGVTGAGRRRVSHLSADDGPAVENSQNMARPARIELAAPRLGGGCSIP